MKVKLEAECTPEEARAFLGLPDVAPLNARLVEEMGRRIHSNADALKPEDMLRSWVVWGGRAQEQFRALLQTVAASAGARKPGEDQRE